KEMVRLNRLQQRLSKRPFRIQILHFTTKASTFGHREDLLRPELVAAFSPDALASLQSHAEVLNVYRLVGERLEMHFDTLLRFVVSRFMPKPLEVEVGAQFAVNPAKQVEIERRRQSKGIIVGGQHLSKRLDKVRAKQKDVAGVKILPYLPHELFRDVG